MKTFLFSLKLHSAPLMMLSITKRTNNWWHYYSMSYNEHINPAFLILSDFIFESVFLPRSFLSHGPFVCSTPNESRHAVPITRGEEICYFNLLRRWFDLDIFKQP